MESDDEDISIVEQPDSTPSSSVNPKAAKLPEPQFSLTHVYKGCTCQVCFTGDTRKNMKRQKFEKISNIEHFKNIADKWQKVDHPFKNVYHTVDWSSKDDKYAHKRCKSEFFDSRTLTRQTPIPSVERAVGLTQSLETSPEFVETETSSQPLRKSARKELTYSSSWTNKSKKRCIICNTQKKVKGRIVPVQTITLTDKAQKTLEEFAHIHIANDNQKYIAGAKRILLTLTSKSLLEADVAYHKRECYEPFRSPAWKRERREVKSTGVEDKSDTTYEEILQLIKVHIITKKEIYTMTQLTAALNEIRKACGSKPARSTDLKQKIKDKFGSEIDFQTRQESTSRILSEYVLPTGVKLTASCIEASLCGGGISASLSLRNAGRIINSSIKTTQQKQPWPPTPHDILTSDSPIDMSLYNGIAWIINPDSQLDVTGKVILPEAKATKVCKIAQDIQSLLPNSQPSLDQVLVSLTMHRKTGSQRVVDTLHKLGHGISYTETMFIEDKWAEWASDSTELPSNIHKGLPTTHIADNIDWKNKGISCNETHNTNSILVQHRLEGPDEKKMQLSKVSLKPNYEFIRKDHRSYKGTKDSLPHLAVKKCNPEPVYYDDEHNRDEYKKASTETLAWVMARRGITDPSEQKVPAWSAFRQLTTHQKPPGVNVGYLPAITLPPTHMNVILSIINRTMRFMTELELDSIFLEVDQAIYNKVLQVLFKFKQEGSNVYDKLIVRMGGFHVVLCLMRTIYSRFNGSGIVELLSEAGIGSEGTIKAALNGANVKQGVRFYKLLFEALLRTKLDALEYQANEAVMDASTNLNESNQEVSGIERASNETFDEAIMLQQSLSRSESMDTDDNYNEIPDLDESQEPFASQSVQLPLEECAVQDESNMTNASLTATVLCLREYPESNFLDKVTSHPDMKLTPPLPGAMATWIDSLIDMVDLLLNVIHFQRTGNWKGYLQTLDEFLPWCFALNRHNYARNMSYYYVDMRDLQRRDPSAYQYLVNGGFSGSLSGNKHTKIPMDQIIEVTINRSSKETGGLSGKTEDAGASNRWIRINHYMAALKEYLDGKIRKVAKSHHVELGSSRMKKDEEAVERIAAGLIDWVPDLWSQSQPLVNIATGVVAPDNMVQNVQSAKERGVKAKEEFIARITKPSSSESPSSPSPTGDNIRINDTVQTTQKPRLLYMDPIKKQPVVTFENLRKDKAKVSIVEDEGHSYAAILAEYDKKELNMRAIMEWPITSKPWAICSEKGGSRSLSKSLFRNNLQLLSPVPPSSSAPTDIDCCIVDAMRVVRMITINELKPFTFRSWARRIIDYLKSLPGTCLHIVFDDYHQPEDSSLYLSKGRPDKGRERRISHLDQQLPQLKEWNAFLTNDSNKRQLTQLLADFLLSEESQLCRDVYVTKGHTCYCLLSQPGSVMCEIPELFSFQREADPRLAFHAVYSLASHNTCVVADDTDVFILLLFVADKASKNLYFRQGTKNSKAGITYHDVKALAQHLGREICKALPAFHVLTGSDFTQPFYGRSKYKCFKKMQTTQTSIKLLDTLAQPQAKLEEVVDFILHVLYNRPKKEKTPGDSRYAMMMSGKGNKRKFTPSQRLPPDGKSMHCHIQRANFVAMCMVNCLDGNFKQSNPLNYGWELNATDRVLQPIWYTGSALPNADEMGGSSTTVEDQQQEEPDEVVMPQEIPQELIGYELISDSDDSDGEDCPSSEESSDEDN